MRLKINGMVVYFPFDKIYKEQVEYMNSLMETLEGEGVGFLEMPTGTGKTVTLLSFILSYQLFRPGSYKKLIYCTRTFPELEKTLEELKFVVQAIKA